MECCFYITRIWSSKAVQVLIQSCKRCVSYRLFQFFQKSTHQLFLLSITTSHLEVVICNHSTHTADVPLSSSFSEGNSHYFSCPKFVQESPSTPIQSCLASTIAWGNCPSAHLLDINTLLFTSKVSKTSPSLLLPSGPSSCAYAGVPSTCQSAASDCRCERWNLCAWLLPPAAGRWRCSNSSARMSAASWPSARPVYRTGRGVPPPAGQTLWEFICKI